MAKKTRTKIYKEILGRAKPGQLTKLPKSSGGKKGRRRHASV